MHRTSTIYAVLGLLGLLGLAGCQEPAYTTVKLPDAPNGRLRGEAKVLSEGAYFRVSSLGAPWSDFKPLIIGQCSKVQFYWTGPNHAVVAYDKMEVQYFVGAPSAWSGAEVTLCNRRASACAKPVTAAVTLPSCDDHTL